MHYPPFLKKIVYILFLVAANGLYAQTTIWEEDFESYKDKVTSGTGTGFAPAGWSSGKKVEIKDGRIEAQNGNEKGIWKTDFINIRGFQDIKLSFSVRHFNTQQKNRFAFRYRLDEGAWVNLVDPVEEPDSSYTFSIPAGNSLELEALFNTKNGNGEYTLDDVLLRGTPPACPNVLDYEFYDLVPPGNTVDNIPATGALATGQIGDFDVRALQNAVNPGNRDMFSIRYKGYVHIPNSGNYTFYTNSDDGSALFIDGDKIVDNDGNHAMQENSGSVMLTSGFHEMEILYFENTGNEQLEVGISGPGISKMALPFSHLYSDCNAPGTVECPRLTSGPNLVFNGDFESWFFNGWEGPHSKWQEPDPGTYAFFEDYSSGSESIYQTLSVTTGETYLLSFDVGTNSTYANSSTLNVKVAGNLLYTRSSDQLFVDNGGNSTYSGGAISNTSTISVEFTASSNSVILDFEGVSNAHLHDTFFLDNITVYLSSIEDCDIDDENPMNVPPTIEATGNQVFCQGSIVPIVETVTITDPDDTQLGHVFIQISSNYDAGDLLTLTNSNPGITASWSALEGKLTLTGPADLAAFETAIKNVRFSSTATLDSDIKNFSIVIAEANYLQSTGHYYEFIPAVGITWTAARDAAALRKFYGLQGYLATITSDDEAQLLGTQASGAGWIGASDVAVEGQWRWVTGPEAGTLFWSGGVSGSTTAPYNYANWNASEPNNSGNEDYAHINAPGTGFDGSWNDLSNTGASSGNYQPKGYLVEYGGMPGDPPAPIISAVTSLTPFAVNPTDQPVDQTVFTGSQAHFGVTVNNADVYRWQVSTDGGASYSTISDGPDYSGTRTESLTVLRTDLDKNNNLYRVRARNRSVSCNVFSSGALLKINVRTVITNKRITHRVDQ